MMWRLAALHPLGIGRGKIRKAGVPRAAKNRGSEALAFVVVPGD